MKGSFAQRTAILFLQQQLRCWEPWECSAK